MDLAPGPEVAYPCHIGIVREKPGDIKTGHCSSLKVFSYGAKESPLFCVMLRSRIKLIQSNTVQ